MKALIFYQDLNNFNHTHKVLGFLSLKAHKFFKPENLIFFLSRAPPPKTKYFCFLNKIEQNVLYEEKKT